MRTSRRTCARGFAPDAKARARQHRERVATHALGLEPCGFGRAFAPRQRETAVNGARQNLVRQLRLRCAESAMGVTER